MQEYEIICIAYDNDGIITYVGLKGQSTMSVPVAARLINDGIQSFILGKMDIKHKCMQELLNITIHI